MMHQTTSKDIENEVETGFTYLDAVAAGRKGDDCTHTFNTCPISLLSVLRYAQESDFE